MTTLFLNSHFTAFQYISLYGGVLLMIFAVIAWHGLQKHKIGLILLVISAIILRFSFIQFDSFLHIWDERFHALVARNLIDNPLKPTLYQNPLLPYNPDVWITNHIWLHKPPLFLWQIALSIKLFGINEFAIRFPSALMSILMLFFLWQIGKITLNKHIAFYALLLYIPSSYFLELTTGFFPTDHNDIAFIFYVTTSIWGWVRYNQNKQMRFVILTGIFSGLAVLTKWLPGIIVYSAWGSSILLSYDLRTKSKSYIHIGISILTALIVFIPWQIYTYFQFPSEFAYTSAKKAEHFFEVIEGHDGTIWYHLNILNTIYAKGIKFLLIPALILLYRKLRKKEYKVGFLTLFLIVFIFYSLAATKMPAFTLIASSIVFLAIGTLIYEIFFLFKLRYYRFKLYGRISAIALLTVCIFWFLNIKNIQKYHTDWEMAYAEYRNEQTQQANTHKAIAELNLPKNTVIINCHQYEAVMCMFYTGLTAYDFIPQTIDTLIQKKLPILVLNSADIPQKLTSYPYCTIYDNIKQP